jgi:hypothetical protein
MRAPSVVVALVLGLGPAEARADQPDGAVLALPIAARSQAAESPRAGWCGETAIQEALLHAGAWAPQRAINRAGKPAHPDLYSQDIPVALTERGVRSELYAHGKGFEPFARWVRTAHEQRDPVRAGVKILPTAHPDWGLDHFVLAVGHGTKGLLVNTTWGSRRWVGDTTTPGLSLRDAFYGIRILGFARAPGESAPRLTVLEEGATTVKLRVTCAGQPDKDVTAPADRLTRFRCAAP